MAQNELNVNQSSLLTHRVYVPGATELERGDGMYEIVPSKIMRSHASIMIWAANTYIKPLHDVYHDQTEIDYMNKYGLHIFLFEPLCSYFDGDPDAAFGPFNCGFYSEYPNKNPDPELNGAAELDSISMYCHHNQLTNVTVHTGDYDVEKNYPRYTNQMKLLCNDLFMRSLSIYDHVDTSVKNRLNIKKKFISTNWRFTPVRCVVSALLAQRDSHLGWFYNTPEELMSRVQWLDYDNLSDIDPIFYQDLKNGLLTLNQNAPYCLDLVTDQANQVTELFGHFYPQGVPGYENHNNPVAYNPVRLTIQDYYRESLFDVVNESRFAQPTANLSEKVVQSMQYKTPFLLLAPQHSIRYLKEFGYKTFDRWWDESYDELESHLDRARAVHKIICRLDSMSYDDLYSMYLEMMPVLEHNFETAVYNTTMKRQRKLSEVKWDELKETQWAAESLGVVSLDNLDTTSLSDSADNS